ncbi:MAG: hypothetical protein AAFV80_13270 [Bacteroidota bacterium]
MFGSKKRKQEIQALKDEISALKQVLNQVHARLEAIDLKQLQELERKKAQPEKA